MKTSFFKPKQPISVNLEFESEAEAADLLRELTTWSPHGGYGTTAGELFKVLKEASRYDPSGETQ